MMSAAEAPSVSGEAFPGVIRQAISGNRAASRSSRKTAGSPASASAVVPARTVSSVVTTEPSGRVTATTSPSNPPDAQVAAARSWERAANASSSSRLRFQRAAMSSAETPWPTRPSGKRARRAEPNGSAPCTLDPIGARLIDSTPQAMTTSLPAAMTLCAAKVVACWLEPHWRSMVVPGVSCGRPAASAAFRAMFCPCSPDWVTQPA